MKTSLPSQYRHLSVWERVRLRLAAYARKDEVEARRLNDSATVQQTPTLPHLETESFLYTLALMYTGEQLESLASHFFWKMMMRDESVADKELSGLLARQAGLQAFLFRTRLLGWKRFCTSIGVDADDLVARNHEGVMVTVGEYKVASVAPSAEEVTGWLRLDDPSPGPLITEESEYRSWRGLLEKATRDPPSLRD